MVRWEELLLNLEWSLTRKICPQRLTESDLGPRKRSEFDGYQVNGTRCRVQIISRAFGGESCTDIQKSHYADGLSFNLCPQRSVHGSLLARREPGRVLESPKFQVFLKAMLRLISTLLERWKCMIVALSFQFTFWTVSELSSIIAIVYMVAFLACQYLK
jgi:hypothetical protein